VRIGWFDVLPASTIPNISNCRLRDPKHFRQIIHIPPSIIGSYISYFFVVKQSIVNLNSRMIFGVMRPILNLLSCVLRLVINVSV